MNKRNLLTLFDSETTLINKEKFLEAIVRIENKFQKKCSELQKKSDDLKTKNPKKAAKVAQEFLDVAEEYYVFKKILDLAVISLVEKESLVTDMTEKKIVNKGDLN